MLSFIFKYIGFLAAFCTTISFLPQAIKVYRSKSTKDISLYMFLIFTIGTFCWLIYGIVISSVPIMIANTITLILSFFILIYKIRYK
jgi:MtN3 and saliva related transmembrane protein